MEALDTRHRVSHGGNANSTTPDYTCASNRDVDIPNTRANLLGSRAMLY